MNKYLPIHLILTLVLTLSITDRALATWSYFPYQIPYTVTAPTNQAPVVNAGPDKNITQPTSSVNVVGTATDPDGTIASTQWTKISGPSSYTIASPSQLTTDITNLTIGTYVFRLTATDNLGLSASDDMQVTVSAQSDLTAGSVAPVSVVVGTVSTLQATITNQGSASTGSSFQNFFQIASSSNGGGTITDLVATTMTTLSSGASGIATKSYTFSSIGTKSARACADKASSGDSGSISESNEGNNCGPWTNITVTSAAVSGSCTPVHYSCYAGTSTNNVENPTNWTWTCAGSNGGSSASCQEMKVLPQCKDGIDNDGDGKIDYKDEPTADPAGEGDPGCSSGDDDKERNPPIFFEF
jgi:hypothetical protein